MGTFSAVPPIKPQPCPMNSGIGSHPIPLTVKIYFTVEDSWKLQEKLIPVTNPRRVRMDKCLKSVRQDCGHPDSNICSYRWIFFFFFFTRSCCIKACVALHAPAADADIYFPSKQSQTGLVGSKTTFLLSFQPWQMSWGSEDVTACLCLGSVSR